MFDLWKTVNKKIYGVFIVILLLLILYIYTIISNNKAERERMLREYDFQDNHTDYFETYADAANDGFHHLMMDIKKKVSIKKQIQKWNQGLMDINIKSKSINKAPIVMVVQVHNRPLYLWEFLKSLKDVLGVMNTVLVLSHDFYNEELISYIKTIHFVTIIQIFYPYSKQLHPNVFPGEDKKFCDAGWRCKEDNDGVLRNAGLAQLKHHWWWKANYIFDKLAIMKTYEGLVVFLEEDQYVTADFLYALRILNIARKTSCNRCDVLSVGAYPPLLFSYNTNSTLYVEEFGSTPLSMGIAFNRTTWNRIKNLRQYFCYYNDADWAASLRFLTSRLPEGRLTMLTISGSRVIHFGKCGVHTLNPDLDCDVTAKLEIIEQFVSTVKESLFPKHFVLKGKKRYTNVTQNGDFGDVRDHELCMFFSQ